MFDRMFEINSFSMILYKVFVEKQAVPVALAQLVKRLDLELFEFQIRI